MTQAARPMDAAAPRGVRSRRWKNYRGSAVSRPLRLHRTVSIAGLALLALLLTAAGGFAGGLDPMGTGAPPAWLTPGTRITWYVASASIAGSYYGLAEDPAGPLVDPRTGRRYAMTGTPASMGTGASGEGIAQADIVAVEGTTVVAATTYRGYDRASGVFAPGRAEGVVSTGGDVDGSVIDPTILAGLTDPGIPGVLVLRGPYDLEGMTYDTVSLVRSSDASYVSATYDATSGVLLASTSTVAGVTSPVTLAGEPPPVGERQLGTVRYVGARTVGLPGVGAPLPAWVTQGTTLRWVGAYRIATAADPGAPAMDYPAELTLMVEATGAGWAAIRTRGIVRMAMDEVVEETTATGAAGPWWIDPAALASLEPGDLLDTDPITGEQVRVDARDTARIRIRRDIAGSVTLHTYDLATGVARTIEQTQTALPISFRLDLAE